MKPSSDSQNSASSASKERKPEPRSVYVVEDHPITRAGLVALIGSEPDLWVCGQADTLEIALSEIRALSPNIVVTDIAIRGSSGIELIRQVLEANPMQLIVAVSLHDESVYAERVIRMGARGYLMKNEGADMFIPALRHVLAGEIYLSDPMMKRLLAGFRSRANGDRLVFPTDTLSEREREVFQLIGNGFTTKEISTRLSLSVKTVDSYREHLKSKLRLDGSAELVRHAILWAGLEKSREGIDRPVEDR